MLKRCSVIIDKDKSKEFIEFMKKNAKTKEFWEENKRLARTPFEKSEIDRLYLNVRL